MTLRPLVEVHDGSAFGGKAVQLGAALRAGLPVPSGFALAHAQVDAITDPEQVVAATARVDDLVAAFASLGGPVAVRSSAVGEDGATASFAGQHATVLGVTGAASLIDAIRTVRASAHAPAAIAYRERLGLFGAPKMGVVVQRLVDADKAGVLFTKHPMTGADERVIEAAWGLGEVVVAGLVTPDRFRIARDARILERAAGDKDIAIKRRPDGGTHEIAIAPDRAAALCLDDRELLALHELALQCERHANGPQDIEWAFVGETLYLLQQRAITRTA